MKKLGVAQVECSEFGQGFDFAVDSQRDDFLVGYFLLVGAYKMW